MKGVDRHLGRLLRRKLAASPGGMDGMPMEPELDREEGTHEAQEGTSQKMGRIRVMDGFGHGHLVGPNGRIEPASLDSLVTLDTDLSTAMTLPDDSIA